MISLVTNYLRQAVHLSFVAFYSRKINKISQSFFRILVLWNSCLVQKSQQKHTTKNFVGFHKHSPLLTMRTSRRFMRTSLFVSSSGRCFYTLHARYRNDTNFISFQSQLMTNGWSLLTWSEQNRSPNVWMLSSSAAWHSRRQSTFAFFSWLQAFDHRKMVSDG